MPEHLEFQGFSKETVKFFRELKRNNNAKWFDAHRKDYEAFVMNPAKAFVVAMGERLRTLSPNIIAIPKVNKSLFRINRDTRFSPDKSPYKSNLGIFFWEGSPSRMECPGFYFHLEPPIILLGVGIYMIPKYLFDAYRNSVVHSKYGKELGEIVARISKMKDYKFGGKHYKRVPAGYDPSHPNAELLLHNGLHVGYEASLPEELYSKKFVNYCFEKFRPIYPLHCWLVALMKRYRSRAFKT
jgi:uncharacterized protein (TIGR02453 family)